MFQGKDEDFAIGRVPSMSIVCFSQTDMKFSSRNMRMLLSINNGSISKLSYCSASTCKIGFVRSISLCVCIASSSLGTEISEAFGQFAFLCKVLTEELSVYPTMCLLFMMSVVLKSADAVCLINKSTQASTYCRLRLKYFLLSFEQVEGIN